MRTRKDLEVEIISILSSQRSSDNKRRPKPISLTAITAYLQHRLSPNAPEISREDIQEVLGRLEAKGDIIPGPRRTYGMARPFVVFGENGLDEAMFVGDRAYLATAAKCLETVIDAANPIIRSELRPEQARERLSNKGIGMLSLADLQQKLPLPCPPAAHKLQYPFQEKSPFDICAPIDNYDPSLSQTQSRRWYALLRGQPQRSPLYRLPDHNYAWFDGEQTFELDRSIALLSMFFIDQQANAPALVMWDEQAGVLDLSDLLLPLDYWRVVSRLSDEVEDRYRRRFVRSRYREAIKATFLRLGIEL